MNFFKGLLIELFCNSLTITGDILLDNQIQTLLVLYYKIYSPLLDTYMIDLWETFMRT